MLEKHASGVAMRARMTTWGVVTLEIGKPRTRERQSFVLLDTHC